MKKIKLIIPVLLIMIASTSCDTYLDVNTDPNNPTEVTPDLVLPVGQWYTADLYQDDRGINHLGNMMMFNWGEAYGFSWYDEEFNYLVTTTFYDDLFDRSYSSALKQYHILTELDAEVYGSYKAIGMIMKAYHFQLLVDLYGDVPYSEALLRGENPTPAYDDASLIYDDLLVQLNDAISTIKTAEESATNVLPGEDDTMFGGDMTSWIQFANTLKVRILTRLSDVRDAAFIQDELNIIATEGSGYITGDAGINPGYLVEENKQNTYWDELGWDVSGTVQLTNDATCATQFIIDYLQNTNDPRISLMYEEPADGHLGVDQGADNNDPALGPDFVSNIGPGHLKSPTMTAVIFTEAELYFNLAELAFKGFGGDPKEYYYDGVLASMDYLAPDATNNVQKRDSYLNQSFQNVSYDASSNKLEAILTQKWLATNGITAEQSWFDYSRTGLPSFIPVSEDASTDDRPVRLAYPASEITANNENVPDQPNVFTNKIFWAN